MWGKVSCLRKQHNGREWAHIPRTKFTCTGILHLKNTSEAVGHHRILVAQKLLLSFSLSLCRDFCQKISKRFMYFDLAAISFGLRCISVTF